MNIFLPFFDFSFNRPKYSVQMNKDTHLDDIANCYLSCNEMLRHCLEMKGEHSNPDHLLLLVDCADICQVLLNFNYINSNAAKRVAELCAQICERCAASCAEFKEDPEMEECSAICKKCAQSCRELSGMEPVPS